MTAQSNPGTPLLPGSLRRALHAMQANYAHDWRLAELARVAGVSVRTLQRLFRAFLSKSPQVELADIRFGHARQALLLGPPAAKVAEIAARCGFSHFGRFSIEYRRRYHEAPSRTLRRRAMFTGVLSVAPGVFSARRDAPTIVVKPIETDRQGAELARDAADQVSMALLKAGLCVAGSSTSARYHMTGALRGAPEHPRLMLQLVEVESGRHLWAYHASHAFSAEFGFEEQIAARIVASLQPQLRQSEIDRACRKRDRDLTPTDLALRALPGVLSLDAAGNARALELLERAIDSDPDHALALALAAWAHAQRVVYHFSSAPLGDHARSARLAHRALARSKDATLLSIVGSAFTLLHDIETADRTLHRALCLDGGSAWAWSRRAWIDVYGGDAEAAIDQFKISLDLAPHDALAFNSLVGLGCAHFKAGRYADAASWQRRALERHPSAVWVHRTLCPAYLMAGARSEAQSSLNALRQHYPDLTVSQVWRGLPPLPFDYRDLVVDALSSLGLPR